MRRIRDSAERIEASEEYENMPDNNERIGYGNIWVLTASLLCAVTVGLGLIAFNWKFSAFMAGSGFVLTYLVLLALWGEDSDFAADLSRGALDPPGKWWIFSFGLALTVISLLGSDLLVKLLSGFEPFIKLGPDWVPPLMFFAGVTLVSMPLVKINVRELGIEARLNIGFLVFLPSFLGYIILISYYFLTCGPLRTNDTVIFNSLRSWGVLPVLSSGLVVVVSIILENRTKLRDIDCADPAESDSA